MTPLFALLRPRQWLKNAFVLAPLLFAGLFTQPQAWLISLEAMLFFLLLSCLVYVMNDWRDRAEDRLHPVKRLRPLASGAVSGAQALALAGLLLALALLLAVQLPTACWWVALCYLALNAAYTLRLKRVALVDVFCIACCYVMRVLMGAYALSVAVSPWIVLATFLLALFLGFGKRYHEMGFADYVAAKPNLQGYSRELLARLVTLCAGAALMTYALYSAEIARKLDTPEITYTTLFVAFGLLRYLQAITVHGQGGEPEMAILKDPLQLGNGAIWLMVTLALMF
jgi:decaprenyl-phosphate phosphoribosyltransferase